MQISGSRLEFTVLTSKTGTCAMLHLLAVLLRREKGPSVERERERDREIKVHTIYLFIPVLAL